MRGNLISTISPNAALLIDAAGCFFAACILMLSETVWSWTDLPVDWRQPVMLSLFIFSVLLVVAARYQGRPFLALAVLGNIAWIIGGAIALFVTGTVLGGFIIAMVIVADAIMAWLQAQGLRSKDVVAHNAAR